MTDSKPDPADDFGRYIAALGHLVHSFAKVETTVRMIFAEYVGISEKKLIALFDGTTPQLSRTIATLKRLMSLSGSMSESDTKAIYGAFEHLGFITLLRDRLVHSGGHPLATGQILVRSMWKDRVLDGKDPSTFFDIQEIFNACIDLQTIDYKLLYHFAFTGLDSDFHRSLKIHTQTPWRYKHREPLKKNQSQKAQKGR